MNATPQIDLQAARTLRDSTVADRVRPRRMMFVVNPKAGGQRGGFAALANAHLPSDIRYEVQITQGPGHAETIAQAAARAGFDTVVAVGGDGTVNEVGRGLLETPEVSLAIVPAGSGNGVARHLRIPMDMAGALRRLGGPLLKAMDVGYINGRPFFCTAGLGFDAHVSRHFASSRRRGLASYARIALTEYRGFRAKQIRLERNGETLDASCYVLAFANASQYGNNAYIAPRADVSDGLLDLCLIERLPLRRALRVAYGLAIGDLPKSRAAKYERASAVRVRAEEPIGFHVDGEYIGEAEAFEVFVSPLAIKVRV